MERHFKIGEALSVEEMVERTEENGEGVEMLRGTSPLSVGMDTDENGEIAKLEPLELEGYAREVSGPNWD